MRLLLAALLAAALLVGLWALLRVLGLLWTALRLAAALYVAYILWYAVGRLPMTP